MYANFAVFGSSEEAHAVLPKLLEAGVASSNAVVLDAGEGEALDAAIREGKASGFITGPTEGRIRKALEGGSTLLAFKTHFGTTWRPMAVISEAEAPLLDLWQPNKTSFLTDVFGPLVFEYRPRVGVTKGLLTSFIPFTMKITPGLGIPLVSSPLLTKFIPLVINYKPRG
jgi:hypothetical protein